MDSENNLVAGGVGMGEQGERDRGVLTSSYEINESWAFHVRHRENSQ